MKKRIAIIGAGVTGLSTAQLLTEANFEVVLFEKNEIPGGLISCSRINGVLFHKVGGHVFNSRIQRVLDWYWSKFDKSDFSQIKRVAKIFITDKILGYPIENYIYMLDEKTIGNIVNELLLVYKADDNTSAENFDDFLKKHFGDTLYSIYFKPYNDKIWKTDLRDLPLEWLEGKLPMPNIPEILTSNIVCAEESTMVHSTFWYPKNGGSQFLANTLAKNLDIRFNQTISSIKRDNKQWFVNEETFDHVVYTGDVRMLKDILSDEIIPIEIKNQLSALKSNGTSNVLCEIDKNDFSWMYFPESKYKIHRIIYTGNFAETNNGNVSRNTCTIEFSGLLSEEDLTAEIVKLPGSPKVLAYNYEPNSYIYHTHQTPVILSKLKSCLDLKSFYLVGRFAEWEYYNMDKAIEAGMLLTEKLIKKDLV